MLVYNTCEMPGCERVGTQLLKAGAHSVIDINEMGLD